MLTDAVRRHCAEVAASARHVRIDPEAEIEAGGISGLDPELHFLEGTREDVTRYVLILDSINFGSGWFTELAVDTDGLTERLTAHVRERGAPWSNEQLRRLEAHAVADVLGLERDHQLTRLYAAALNHLGHFLGARPATGILAPTAEATAQRLTEMPFFDDTGFYKRAQITANDLHLAGVAEFGDRDRLTIFADNLVPHVLRLDGVLVYSDELAARIDAGIELPPGCEEEVELRACAVHACEGIAQRLGVMPALLDNWLWNRGVHPPYTERRPHITRTVYY